MKRRDANLILVAMGAFGGGAIMLSLPLELFERVTEKAGLSVLVPTLAPPLGLTEHMLFAAMGAVLCALLVASILPWSRPGRADGTGGGTVMSVLFSKIASFTRGGSGKNNACLEPYDELNGGDAAPVLRRSDAHPDAPARAPLFARRDLGGEALPPVADGFDEPSEMGMLAMMASMYERPSSAVRDITGLSMPRAPEPLPWELIEQEMNRVLKGAQFHAQPDVMEGDPADVTEEAEPRIADLADRLEKGLTRRRERLSRGREGSAPTTERQDSSLFQDSSLLEAMKDMACAMPVADLKNHGEGERPANDEEDRHDDGLERALDVLRNLTMRAGQDKVA
ncbi:MAG: hypothetical protein EP321_05575 [Sphingomonadales bacterium]|nr:MAG: hypothetical protein EP345_01265 [Sphingomonadales bacterium]TNF04863.1 MAG: hypothetical protein EP321_05575 [Sphingomonadales bacterium]